MRAKFVNADGGWQYRLLPPGALPYEMQFAIMPRLTFNHFADDSNLMVTVRRRRFEYRGKNENNIPVYMEVVE